MSDVDDSVDHQELDRADHEQRELLRAPDLNRSTNRSATRLELFFDLAFVLFVARCADLLAQEQSWGEALRFAALLTAGWWAWASTTLHANRFDTDDAVFRLLTLAGMAGVAGMAAGVDGVGGPAGRWFALGYVAVRASLIVGYLRAWVHVASARPSIRPYLIGHSVGGAIWLASVAVPAPARYVLWAVGIAVDLVAPLAATRQKDRAPVHLEHLPERFALFIILVLGESVAAVVTGLHDGGWTGQVTLAAALAFLIAAALWWLYFDLAGAAAKRRLVEEGDRSSEGVHDFYLYAHLPVALSLAAVAVGLEHAVVHAGDEHLSGGTRAVLGVGLAGYLASSALIQGVLSRRPGAALLWPGSGVPAVLAVAALDVAPSLLLAMLATVLVVGLAAGIAQHRAGRIRTVPV